VAATTKEVTSTASPAKGSGINVRDYGLLAALVVIVLLFQWRTDGKLLAAANVNNLIMQNAYVVILAVGMIMVIIAGHIDLSVGSGVAMLGGFVAVAIMQWHWPVLLAVFVTLLLGALLGCWQGYWVAFVGIPGFIVTLSGMLTFRGGALIILHGGTIGGLPESFVSIGARWFPNWFGHFTVLSDAGFTAKLNDWLPGWLGFSTLFGPRDVLTLVFGLVAVLGLLVSQVTARGKLKARGLPRESRRLFVVKNAVISLAIMYLAYVIAGYRGTPYILLILAVLVVVYTFVLGRTVFGRHVYAMGGNRFAALMSGVKTRWVDFFVFVNIGVLMALAGIVSTARASGAVAGAGSFFELDAIAACFIGGTSVSGGVGKISGAVTGAFLIGVINQGLSIMNVEPAWQQVIKGLVLIAAVAFDLINRRRSGNN
jgi:putative multiple sugar transport system permease protein